MHIPDALTIRELAELVGVTLGGIGSILKTVLRAKAELVAAAAAAPTAAAASVSKATPDPSPSPTHANLPSARMAVFHGLGGRLSVLRTQFSAFKEWKNLRSRLRST